MGKLDDESERKKIIKIRIDQIAYSNKRRKKRKTFYRFIACRSDRQGVKCMKFLLSKLNSHVVSMNELHCDYYVMLSGCDINCFLVPPVFVLTDEKWLFQYPRCFDFRSIYFDKCTLYYPSMMHFKPPVCDALLTTSHFNYVLFVYDVLACFSLF